MTVNAVKAIKNYPLTFNFFFFKKGHSMILVVQYDAVIFWSKLEVVNWSMVGRRKILSMKKIYICIKTFY